MKWRFPGSPWRWITGWSAERPWRSWMRTSAMPWASAPVPPPWATASPPPGPSQRSARRFRALQIPALAARRHRIAGHGLTPRLALGGALGLHADPVVEPRPGILVDQDRLAHDRGMHLQV